MEINYNIISFIDILGLVQGVILGSLLILINKKRSKSTLLLGIFIICFAIDNIPDILEDLHILKFYPEYTLLPINFSWLLFPIFFVYVQKVSILTQKQTSYWVLVPGLLFLILNTILFFQNTEFKIKTEDSLWFNLLQLLGIFYSLTIGFLTVKWINKHAKLLKEQYTLLEHKELKWAKLFVIIGLSFSLTNIFFIIFTETGFYFDVIISAVDVIILYWVSLKGILQQNVPSLINFSDQKNNDVLLPKTNDYALEPQQNYSDLLQTLEKHMLEEKAYNKEDLTIIDVAEKIGVHPKKVSTAINSQLNQNFNTYINSYRIEEAKKLLKSDLTDTLSIEGIAYEVGFQSKSTFYDAFKKFTQMTPTRFKNS